MDIGRVTTVNNNASLASKFLFQILVERFAPVRQIGQSSAAQVGIVERGITRAQEDVIRFVRGSDGGIDPNRASGEAHDFTRKFIPGADATAGEVIKTKRRAGV